jgi:hypothetical protein
MSGRKGISMADVVNACLSLMKEGRNLGPTNVRLQLGRGSMTTISRHLQTLGLRQPHELAVSDRREVD